MKIPACASSNHVPEISTPPVCDWQSFIVDNTAVNALSSLTMTKTAAVDRNQFKIIHAAQARKRSANQNRVASATDRRVDAQSELVSATDPNPATMAASVTAARRKFRVMSEATILRRGRVEGMIPSSSISAYTVATRHVDASTIHAMVSATAS